METTRGTDDHLAQEQRVPTTSHFFRVYSGMTTPVGTWEEIQKSADEAEEADDLTKLGVEALPS